MKKYITILLFGVFSLSLSAQNIWLGIGETTYRSNIPIRNVNTFIVLGDFDNGFLVGAEISNGETAMLGPVERYNDFKMLAGYRLINIKEVGTSVTFLTSNNIQSVRGKLTAIDFGLGASLRFKIINQIHARMGYSLSALRISKGLDNEYSNDAFSRYDSYSLGILLKLTQN